MATFSSRTPINITIGTEQYTVLVGHDRTIYVPQSLSPSAVWAAMPLSIIERKTLRRYGLWPDPVLPAFTSLEKLDQIYRRWLQRLEGWPTAEHMAQAWTLFRERLSITVYTTHDLLALSECRRTEVRHDVD